MYSLTKNKTKNFFIVLLALLMAITMALATACSPDNGDGGDGNGDGGDNNTTTESTLTDYQVLKNGDFEFMTDDKTVFPKSSSIAWSNSLDSGLNGNTAPSTSSTGKSGIIDTSSEPYSKLENKYKPEIKEDTEPTTYYNPHTPYYYGLVENKFVDNVESADYEANKTYANAKGSKILMIQNKTSNEQQIKGTAQKFKSSTSLTVDNDSYAVFSVWVKTMDLVSSFTDTPGAYVALDFKVGSVTYETIYFNNINTDGEWALLQAKIQGFEYATTTAYVTLGLGKGNALGKTGYVEGFAYFDNAHFEVFNKQEFDATADETVTIKKEGNEAFDLSSKTYKENPTEKTDYSANNSDKFSTFTYNLNLRKTDALTSPITFNGNVTLNTSDEYNKDNVTTNTAVGVATKSTVPASLTDNVSDIDKIDGNNDTNVIYFNFNELTSATYLSSAIELKSNSYNLISFYVKSNAVRLNSDKVKVNVIDIPDVNEDKKSTKSAFESFTTQDASEGNYGEWVKYTVLVDNVTDTDTNYKLEITFGPSKDAIKNDALFLQKGFALIADLKAYKIDKDLYDFCSTGSNLTKLSLKGKYGAYGEEVEEENNDIYNTNVDSLGKLEISSKPTTNLSDFTRKNCGEKVVSGIINSKYNANYTGINNLENFAKLTSNDNTYAQAVVLQNNEALNSALISSAKTLVENSFIKIAVKLNVSKGATANVYVSTNKIVDGNYEVLKIAPNSENYTWSKELKSTVTGTDENQGKWTEVAFYIASGNKPIDYKVEIWLGDRTGNGVAGTVFMENVIVSEYDEASFLYAKDLFVDNYGVGGTYYDEADYVSEKHLRAPTTIKETVDGKEVTTTKYYNEREIYNGNNLTKFVDFTTIFADNEIDNTESTEDTETDTETEEDGYVVKTDVALQISSIIISAVLIIVMIIVFVRTIFKNRKKRKEYVSSFYDRNSREKTVKKIKEKQNAVVLDESNDGEYDYEQAQSIEENVIDVEELNKNPEDLQEDGGSEESTNEEVVETSNEETTEPANEQVEEASSEETTNE